MRNNTGPGLMASGPGAPPPGVIPSNNTTTEPPPPGGPLPPSNLQNLSSQQPHLIYQQQQQMGPDHYNNDQAAQPMLLAQNNNIDNPNLLTTQLHDDSLIKSPHWQHQLALFQISRQNNHVPHINAKLSAQKLKNTNDNINLTLTDATTELLQQYYEREKLSNSANPNQTPKVSEKVDLKLNDEELLKEQENYKRTKYLTIDPIKQYWASVDFSGQGLFSISTKLFNRYDFLTKLYLANNNISSIPKNIKNLRFLRVLDLSQNVITELPKEMNQLYSLRYLYLFDNRITHIPYEFGNMSELCFLGIEGNSQINIEYVRMIAEKGTREFIHYLRDTNPSKKHNILPDVRTLRTWVGVNVDGEFEPKREISFTSNNSVADKLHFTVLSYNILCQHYATAKLYGYTPSWALAWEYRKQRILKEVTQSKCDLVCLQEVETQAYEELIGPELSKHNYRGIFYNKGRARRGGSSIGNGGSGSDLLKKVDGCAIFYKTSKFTMIEKVNVDYSSGLLGNDHFAKTEDVFNRFTNKDNIAIISYMEHRDTKNRIFVVNTHLHWDPAFNDVKTLQVAVLVEELQALAKKHSGNSSSRNNNNDFLSTPIIICGDFNSQIHSAVYELLSKGKSVSHPDFHGVDYGKYTSEGFQQSFKFKSVYDNMGELPFTNFTPNFTEVIDYIWYNTQSIDVVGMLGKIEDLYFETLVGFPDQNHPSDHIPLMAELKFKNNSNLSSSSNNNNPSNSNKNRSRKI